MTMSDLTDEDLTEIEWIIGMRAQVSNQQVFALITEVRRLRAESGAQGATSTDGLDRGEPFVWVVTPSEDNVDVGTVVSTWDTREEAEDFLRGYDGGEAVVPLYRDRLAREAQAPAPDEDEATADLATITDSVGVGDKTYALAWRRTRDRLDAGWRLVPPAPAPDEAATRFRPGDFVTVADGATVGEYVGYEGGPFHRHRYHLVWPDGTRAPEVSAADDPRVSPANPAVLAEYDLTLTSESRDPR